MRAGEEREALDKAHFTLKRRILQQLSIQLVLLLGTLTRFL